MDNNISKVPIVKKPFNFGDKEYIYYFKVKGAWKIPNIYAKNFLDKKKIIGYISLIKMKTIKCTKAKTKVLNEK